MVFGLAGEAALTATVILLQSNVDENYRSRVMGLWFMVSQLSNLLLLAVGPLAQRYGLDAERVPADQLTTGGSSLATSARYICSLLGS